LPPKKQLDSMPIGSCVGGSSKAVQIMQCLGNCCERLERVKTWVVVMVDRDIG
jgi:hypothetical protein